MRLRLLVPAPILLLALSGPASAQLSFQARAAVASAFVWRGLTIVNRPVIQPEVTLYAGPALLDLWANVEPFRYRGAHDLSALAGRPAPGFTELDPSLEVGGTLGGVKVAGGAIAYLFTHAAGYETLPNTLELYGRALLPGALPLQLTGYYDAHTVRGLYLEAGVERPLPGLSPVQLGARAGASLGEATGPESAYYARDGITHLQLSAAAAFVAGPLALRPEANVALGIDDAARVTAPDRTHRAKLWVGVSVAWPAGED